MKKRDIRARIAQTAAVLAALCGFATTAGAYTVTLVSSAPRDTFVSTGVSGINAGDPRLFEEFPVLEAPFVERQTTEFLGASAGSRFVINNTGFSVTFDHSSAVDAPTNPFSQLGVTFQVDEDVNYVLAGHYEAIDHRPSTIFLRTSILDLGETSISSLFGTVQRSVDVANQRIDVVTGGGNDFSSIAGDPVGTLRAGRLYQFRVDAGFRESGDLPFSNIASRGEGRVGLYLTAVPEPGTAVLLGFGLASLSAVRRDRAS